MEKSELERLVALEADMRVVKETTTRIDNKLDVFNEAFVPRREITSEFLRRDEQISNIRTDAAALRTEFDQYRMQEDKRRDAEQLQTKAVRPAWWQVGIAIAAVIVSMGSLIVAIVVLAQKG